MTKYTYRIVFDGHLYRVLQIGPGGQYMIRHASRQLKHWKTRKSAEAFIAKCIAGKEKP